MTPEVRNYFDEQLDVVMSQLPAHVHELIERVPLHVDDYPTPKIMRKLGVRRRGNLCGLYTGVPLTNRSVMHSGIPNDVIQIFREGILNMAVDYRGNIDEEELRKQIRLTILHELGHHHGMNEDELRELGY